MADRKRHRPSDRDGKPGTSSAANDQHTNDYTSNFDSLSWDIPRTDMLRATNILRNQLDDDGNSEDEPLLTPEYSHKPVTEKEEGVSARGAWNIAIALVVLSLSTMSYALFNDAFSQWLYVEFEYMVLGSNASFINDSASSNPCIKGNNNSSPWAAELDEAQARASRFNTWAMLISLLPAVITNTLLGAYADRIGRRVLFILPLFGMMTKYGFTSAVAYWKLNVYWALFGTLLSGLSGSMPALFMAIYVYTADNTGHNKSRSFGMVVAQATMNIFYALTHLVVGYFIKGEGYIWPMFTATLVLCLSLLVCVCFLRETLDTSNLGKRASLIQGVKSVFGFYLVKTDNPRYKRKDFLMLGFVFFMYSTCLGVSIQSLYLMNEPLCWSSVKMGNVITFQGLLSSFASLFLMRLIQKIFSDETISIVSLISAGASRFVLAFAVNETMIFVAYTIGMFENLLLPIIRAILSRMVPSDKRGSLFASVAVIEVATLAVAGAGLDALYSLTVDIWHGLTYFVIAICLVLAATVMLLFNIIIKRRQPSGKSIIVIEEKLNDN
ncbi:unnamed protein product [Lymnaea stagnalis]|uniref:Major facilitator superfamily (MFS) profile domain-containing protein n=1 Tax=Lymnaea stagnalis TaxID=6523 RepID=A0AAV2IJ47_LYMST